MTMTKRKRPLRFRRYPQDQLMRLYRYMESFQARRGFLPSQVEIAERFNASHRVVGYWQNLMVENKMMDRIPGAHRAFKLLPLQETQPKQEV